MPVAWGARKQPKSANHTQEAEVVSMSEGLRNEALPVQALLQTVLQRPVALRIREDNEATITAVRKGYSPRMRYLLRTHRIALGTLKELTTEEPESGEGRVTLEHWPTASHKGDMFTKALAPNVFQDAVVQLGNAQRDAARSAQEGERCRLWLCSLVPPAGAGAHSETNRVLPHTAGRR